LKRFFNNKGFSLAEMAVTTGLMGVLALVIYSVSRYTDKEIKIVTEDIQTLILKYGANKVLLRDLVNSTPSYNYLELADDSGKPFFVHATNELCQTDCERKFSLNIPAGDIKSRGIFFLVNKRKLSEQVMMNYPLKIENTLNASQNFGGINAIADITPSMSISKSNIPLSPWEKDRILLITSNVSFYDCLNHIHGSSGSNCNLTCADSPGGPGSCNYVAKRPFKILGIVDKYEKNLIFTNVNNNLGLLKKKFRYCSSNESMQCGFTKDVMLDQAANFITDLPFVPGYDNQAQIQPVELVRYHLEKPSPNAREDKTMLMRSVATVVGTNLSFQRAHVLLTGVKSIVFTRKNLSNATIEFKIDKVKLQNVIK
jgi:prepilin-type N-terminal cleavage/methylation domain-containing protein